MQLSNVALDQREPLAGGFKHVSRMWQNHDDIFLRLSESLADGLSQHHAMIASLLAVCLAAASGHWPPTP
jgi:hypothetical protein